MKVEDFLKDKKPKVTNIKYRIVKIKEKQDSVLIYLDNDEKINVSVESYFSNGLSSLKGLDDSLYNKLKDEERLLNAYNGCLRKLSSKDYTVKQIKDYLYVKKQLHKNEVETIISKLNKYGLLDDDKYCLNRVNYLNKQLYSLKQIKSKLINEGIGDNLIDKYLINNYDDEYKKVSTLAAKYSNSIKNKSVMAKKQAILTKLTGLGYSYDISKLVIDKLRLSNDDELSLLKKEYDKAKIKYSRKYEDYELRSHIYAYLLNKGFKSDDIKKIMED